MAGTAQFCPGCGTRTLPPAHAIPVGAPPSAKAPARTPTIAPVVSHAPAAGTPPPQAKRSTFFIWVPIAVIGLGLLAWAVLSGLPFSGEPDRPKSRPMDVVTEQSTPTATLTEISDTAPEMDERERAPATTPRPTVNRTPAPAQVRQTPAPVPVRQAPVPAPVQRIPAPAPVITRTPPPSPVPQPVPVRTRPPEPSRTAGTRAGGEISDSEAVGVLRSYISSRDYGVSTDCLSVNSRGYRNVGYDLQASDSCTGRSIGRWRVDSKTREVFRQRPDGRYLRP